MKYRFGLYFLFIIIFYSVFFLKAMMGQKLTFYLLSVYLTIYLIYEIITLKQYNKSWGRTFLSPIVLASIFTFILSFGLSNFLYFNDDSFYGSILYGTFGPDSYLILNNAMPSIFLGAFAMWQGYKTNLGKRFFIWLTYLRIHLIKYIRNSFNLNYILLYFFILTSIAARLLSIKLGIFGYSSEEENIYEYSSISQYLFLLGSLGKLCLTVVSLAYFYNPNDFRMKFLLFSLLLFEMIFGLLSGMKSGMVLPFIIIIASDLIMNKRFNKKFIFFGFTFIIISYMLIEPFRTLRYMDPNFQSSPQYIVGTIKDAYELNQNRRLVSFDNTEDIIFSFFKRWNYMLEVSKAVDYNDNIGLSNSDPNFKSRLLTFPLQAVVPRFLWEDKPMEDIGGWFTHKVWGWDIKSSTGMTPIGFLYFAGGNVAIFIIFFLIGIMQNTLYRFVMLGAGGIIIYFGLLHTVVFIDSSVNGIFVDWIRLLPALVILQSFLLRNKRSPVKTS